MTKCLLVKMSSFGDVLHTLPAIHDAHTAKQLTFDWAIEPSFAAMARLNKAVNQTIDVPLRDMRRHIISSIFSKRLSNTVHQLRDQTYDVVLDAQGLVKSAMVAKLAKGRRLGFDKHSAREPIASRFYHQGIEVSRDLHAVERTRSLFAQVFEYDYQSLPLNYGIDQAVLPQVNAPKDSVLFLHGTTWATKHWPEHYWQQLARLVSQSGFQVLLPWGDENERHRAQRIAESVQGKLKPKVLDKMSLLELAGLMTQVNAAVAVDTGLGHLASALALPCISLYGSTDPKRTGTYGLNQSHLYSHKSCAPCLKRSCALQGTFEINPPCFESVNPTRVWEKLQPLLLSTSVQRRLA